MSLKIALAKGSLQEGAFKYLASLGFIFEDLSAEDIANFQPSKVPRHKLILKASLGERDIEILLVRGHDVPAYVEHGAADLGIVGLDVIRDSGADLVKLRDLDYGHCKLCVAVPKGLYKSLADLPNYARVATTFPNLSREFFNSKGFEVEIINLYGSVEIAPLTNLSDIIVDLVATGKTLSENGLEPIHTIMDCSAYLIANRSSFQLHKKLFLEL